MHPWMALLLMQELRLNYKLMNKNISRLFQTAFILSMATIIIALAEAFFSTYFGFKDESLTLFGFGVGSFIEVISAVGVAYMIYRIQRNAESKRSQFEKTALKITGGGFYILVAGLLISAVYNIYIRHVPASTLSGIIISLISIVLMLLLYFFKMKVGRRLGSDAIIADAECTKVCIYMSGILLISSGVYYLTKFIYTDSIGTILLAYLSYKEGKECFEKAVSEKHCSC